MLKWLKFIICLIVIALISPAISNYLNAHTFIKLNVASIKKNNILDFIVSYIKHHNNTISIEKAYHIATVVYVECENQNIDVSLIIAQQRRESHFRSNVVGKQYGAIGLGQIRHEKWTWYGPYNKIIQNKEDLFDPKKGTQAQILILKTFIKWENGDINKALRRYSGSAKKYAENVLLSKRYLDSKINSYLLLANNYK